MHAHRYTLPLSRALLKGKHSKKKKKKKGYCAKNNVFMYGNKTKVKSEVKTPKHLT